MSNMLITGGAGFIGAHLVRRLVNRGDRVALLLKPSTDTSRIADIVDKIERFDGDTVDRESLKRCIDRVKPDHICHLAASNIKSGVTASAEEVIRTNVLGMHNLLVETKDVPYQSFIHTGSYLEYGKRSDPIRESDRCEPTEMYAVTKLGATLTAQAFARQFKKPTVTLRIFSPYGPLMQQGRLVREVITRALKNEPIRLTAPEIARDFIFVSDIVDLILESMEKGTKIGGEIFNLGSGVSTSLQEFVALVLKQTDSTSKVEWNAFPPVLYDTAHSQADQTKLKAHFSWRPAHSLEAGIAETINWIRMLP